MAGVDNARHSDTESDVVMVGGSEQINLDRFCSLLQEHAEGSVNCEGADCAMLFGSTGVGKSTLLHLLAGAEFSVEAVEMGTDEDDEFGGEIEMQLITQMKIEGCDIDNSATSITVLLRQTRPRAHPCFSEFVIRGQNVLQIEWNDDLEIYRSFTVFLVYRSRTGRRSEGCQLAR